MAYHEKVTAAAKFRSSPRLLRFTSSQFGERRCRLRKVMVPCVRAGGERSVARGGPAGARHFGHAENAMSISHDKNVRAITCGLLFYSLFCGDEVNSIILITKIMNKMKPKRFCFRLFFKSRFPLQRGFLLK